MKNNNNNKSSDIELITQALKARGYNDATIKQALQEIKKRGWTLENLIDQFITKADKDPHSINAKNCQSGKCTAWDLDKKLS